MQIRLTLLTFTDLLGIFIGLGIFSNRTICCSPRMHLLFSFSYTINRFSQSNFHSKQKSIFCFNLNVLSTWFCRFKSPLNSTLCIHSYIFPLTIIRLCACIFNYCTIFFLITVYGKILIMNICAENKLYKTNFSCIALDWMTSQFFS